MARTYLDTIVEEECQRINAVEIGKHIAERAFRHGVERTHSAYAQNITWCRPMDTVQPGPAEEKCGCGHARHDGRFCPGCDKQCYSGAFWHDRRKGERRKGNERYVDYRGANYRDSKTWYVWQDAGAGEATIRRDRRSGSDRRKRP